MELWIRSQDRTMLCKPQYIELYGDSEVHFGDINIGYRCVATYSTRERALEVLDEIQCFLNGSITKKLYVNGDYCGSWKTQRTEIVYDMPKE